jgi:hypothetical protein
VLVNFAADIISFESSATYIFQEALEDGSSAAFDQFLETVKIQYLLLFYVTESLVDFVWEIASSHKQFFDSLRELQMRVYLAGL